jgi:HAD superfamily hydrolase (TIGR01509 family)
MEVGLIRAVILDLDGLMVDSEPLSRRAWEQVLSGLGCALDDAVYASVIGLRLEDSSRRLQEACNAPLPAPALARLKSEAMAAIVAQGVPTMPGLEALLAEVERRGVLWGVATSSRLQYARTVLDQIGLLSRCRALATGDEVPAGKPAPDVYLLAARRLAVPPLLCLALEDSPTGAAAAVAAGMRTVLVTAEPLTGEDLPQHVARYGSLTEVASELTRLLGPV